MCTSHVLTASATEHLKNMVSDGGCSRTGRCYGMLKDFIHTFKFGKVSAHPWTDYTILMLWPLSSTCVFQPDAVSSEFEEAV